jgi:hypothetical protein
MESAIGELRFTQAGRPIRARLEANYRWTCDDKGLEQFLNTACACEVQPQQWEVHRPAVHTLYQAAERLGAEVCIP